MHSKATACRTKSSIRHWMWYLAAIGPLLLVGCSAEDPQIVSHRERLLLPTEPADVTSIADAKVAAANDPNVLFVGRIVENESDAFVTGRAAFLVMEILPEVEGHGGKDHVEDCPFCRRRAEKAPRAAVQCVDEMGQPLTIDARSLFPLQAGDAVVVRGKGEVVPELDMFRVTADGIYVRR